MRKVVGGWPGAAFAVLMIAGAGCDWIPIRRRVDPSLYPLRARATEVEKTDVEDRVRPTSMAAAPLPPIPKLIPVSDEEALRSTAPTPLLDAALARASAIREATLAADSGRGSSSGALGKLLLPAEPVGVAQPGGDPKRDEPPPSPESAPGLLDPAVASAAVEATVPPPGPEVSSREGNPESKGLLAATSGVVEEASREGGELAHGAGGKGGGSVARITEVELTAGNAKPVEPALTAGQSGGLWWEVMNLLEGSTGGEEPGGGSDEATAGSGGDETRRLRLIDLRLCREVLGLGRVEPIDTTQCRAGQKVIVYCELRGVEYEEAGEGYRSKLKVEMSLVERGSGLVTRIGAQDAEETSEAPRDEYFVGFVIQLPARLEPGEYTFRATPRDEFTGCLDERETMLTVVR